MPYALALMVLCPIRDDYKLVSRCKTCTHYCGLMDDELLSCDLLEDNGEIKCQKQP